jgi:hypothetical protein
MGQTMKSKVVVDIDAPQKKVATLFADPANSAVWREDIERYEPISGKQGIPGSTYRLIRKRGALPLTATLVTRFQNELRVTMDASDVTIEVHGVLSTLPDGRTRLASNEIISFKGVWNKTLGFLGRPAIKKAHRKQIEAFKRFAEHREVAIKESLAVKRPRLKTDVKRGSGRSPPTRRNT